MNEIKSKVTILGGGPAGLTCALFLAKKGIPVTIVEKKSFPRDKICGDALSGKVLSVLKKLDLSLIGELDGNENTLGSYGVNFYAPNGKCLRVPFKSSSPLPPGYTCKRIDFDNYLASKVKACKEITLLENVGISNVSKTNLGFLLENTSKELQIQTELVISADGAHSVFAKKIAGIYPEDIHYSAGLRQYFTNVRDLDKDNFIELHFLKDLLPGYFWIFPLENNTANVGLGMRSDVVSKKKLNLRNILDQIIKTHPAIKERFKEAVSEGPSLGFGLPLGSKRRVISGDNYMLTGDAASLIDPFTGEGISNAMFSGMYAADQVERCLQTNNYNSSFMQQYDAQVYKRLGKELDISTKLQKLVNYPWLFNFVVNKASSNEHLKKIISSMFDDLDLRKEFKNPLFYLKFLK